MDPALFASGFAVGLLIAAPVGPIGVLCMRLTLQEGAIAGLFAGMGAAIADSIFGAVGAFGAQAVSDYLTEHADWFGLGGGLYLVWLGVRTLFWPQKPARVTTSMSNHLAAFATTFVLTLTNPITILAFLGLFAYIGIKQMPESFVGASVIVAGVFVGSAAWWIGITTLISLFRRSVTPRLMVWINRVSGVILGASGLALVGKVLIDIT